MNLTTLFQLKTTWVVIVHLLVITPIFAKIIYDAMKCETGTPPKEQSQLSWNEIGLVVLMVGVAYHLYTAIELLSL
jgi:hypothetical protein